jgi:hypothetical protein
MANATKPAKRPSVTPKRPRVKPNIEERPLFRPVPRIDEPHNDFQARLTEYVKARDVRLRAEAA